MEMKLVLVPVHDALTASHGFEAHNIPGLFFPHDRTLVVFDGSPGDRDIYVRVADLEEEFEDCYGLQTLTEVLPPQIHRWARQVIDGQAGLRAAERLLGPADRKIERDVVPQGPPPMESD